MPPFFSDMVEFSSIHLLDELEACRPLGEHWCYPLERYLGILKTYMQNKARPEASMTSMYMVDNKLGLCMEYFKLYPHNNYRVLEGDVNEGVVGYALEGQSRRRQLTHHEL
jgi:hypothetical protein